MHQHYVPRTYLKNFGLKRKKEFFVNAYNVKDKSNFTTNIKNICGETDLYTLNSDDKDYKEPLIIENGYAKYFEPLYTKVYDLLIDDSKTILTDQERAEILVAIFQFYFRNTKLLNESIEFHKEIIQNKFENSKNKGVESFEYLGQIFNISKSMEEQIETFRKETKYQFKKEHIYGFKELVLRNSWQSINVYKLIDESKFVTCDNPLKNLNLKEKSKNPFQRISQFFLPLNEKYCLFLYNDKTKEYNRIYREEVHNAKAYLVNGKMIGNAQRFVIGNQKSINDTIAFEEIIKTEYENNIHKFMQLIKQTYVVLKQQNATKEHLEVFKKYINLYDKQGNLTESQKKQFLMEAQIQQKKHWINKL